MTSCICEESRAAVSPYGEHLGLPMVLEVSERRKTSRSGFPKMNQITPWVVKPRHN